MDARAPSTSYRLPDETKARPRAITWSRRPACAVCGRRLSHHADGYGGGVAFCPRCALVEDGRRDRHQPRPVPPQPQGRRPVRGRSFLR